MSKSFLGLLIRFHFLRFRIRPKICVPKQLGGSKCPILLKNMRCEIFFDFHFSFCIILILSEHFEDMYEKLSSYLNTIPATVIRSGFSDLKVPKRENFSLAFFAQSEPTWVCDLGSGEKIDFFYQMTPVFHGFWFFATY
jgi:hypothetical protein